MATIHGEHGQHAQDLIQRAIVSGSPTREHLVIVPITQTASVITNLLDRELVPQPKILNCSGVMTTSPSAISSIHFLFGPGSTKDLKVAVAWPQTTLTKKILDRARAQSIRVIETSRTEHDRKMAVIQWLSHLFLVLIGWEKNTHIQESLIKPWKTTTWTIVDMIFANPFAEEIAVEFFESLRKNQNNPIAAFRAISDTHLGSTDRDNFSTPNFDRIVSFIPESQIIIPQNKIASTRHQLNTTGRVFLVNKIHQIRW